GIYLPVLCPSGAASRIGRQTSSFASEPVSSAMGVVADLFRVRNRQAGQRRSAMAQLHRHGRVLPERSAADLDRLVRAAPSALVSRCLGRRNFGDGTGLHLDDPAAAPLPYRSLLYCHVLGSRRDQHCELLLPELSGSLAWSSAVGRPLPCALCSEEVETTITSARACRCSSGAAACIAVAGGNRAVFSATPLSRVQARYLCRYAYLGLLRHLS